MQPVACWIDSEGQCWIASQQCVDAMEREELQKIQQWAVTEHNARVILNNILSVEDDNK